MPIEVGSIAYVKISGEPVFVLQRGQTTNCTYKDEVVEIDQGIFRKPKSYTHKVIDKIERVDNDTFLCRRFVPSREKGSFYSSEWFTIKELSSEAESLIEDNSSLLELLGGKVVKPTPPNPAGLA